LAAARVSPDTGLFYVPGTTANILYLTDPDPRGRWGLAADRLEHGRVSSYLTAIDYQDRQVVWRHQYPGVTGAGGSGGILAAGKVLSPAMAATRRLRRGHRQTALALAHRRCVERA
jgi:hypothetical protein